MLELKMGKAKLAGMMTADFSRKPYVKLWTYFGVGLKTSW
jgi:hypothetical protein